jgi:tetratricopeptide (TPR) repeat protein
MLTPQQRHAGLSADLAQRARGIEMALQQGRVDEAERAGIAALALAPRHPEILRLSAMVQFQRGRFAAAIDLLSQALAQRADDPLIYNALGGAYEQIRDLGRSREAFQRACELGPDLAPCWFNYARRLFADGDGEAAVPALQRVVALQPGHVRARSMLADILRTDGRFAEAEAQLRGIVEADPSRSGSAWWSLAMLKPMPLTQRDIAAMQRILQGPGIAENDRIATGFALAMAQEHAGDYAAAFAQMRRAHALAARTEKYHAAEFARHLDDILAAFATAPVEADAAQGSESIFIASLPRSGSTLTEQIFASHSQVEGTSELHDLGQVIMDECDRLRRPFTEWARTHTPQQWRALGLDYLARTQRWRQRRPRFTDKMPANWMYVGAILAMLPRARVVICRRDPLETCLGCYRYIFTQHAYTHDFDDLASHWRAFDRATKHWQTLYPDRVYVQDYEALVADPEGRIRALLGFCDLPFEENCLNFHATERRVATPSAAQVRHPIRRDTARAGKYGALLDPLRAALGLPPFQPWNRNQEMP